MEQIMYVDQHGETLCHLFHISQMVHSRPSMNMFKPRKQHYSLKLETISGMRIEDRVVRYQFIAGIRKGTSSWVVINFSSSLHKIFRIDAILGYAHVPHHLKKGC